MARRYRRRTSKGRFASFGRKSHRRHYKGLGRRKGRRGHRRSFRGFGDFPSLATLKSSVNGQDALIGAAIGLLGVFAVNYYVGSKINPTAAAGASLTAEQLAAQAEWRKSFADAPWKFAAYGLAGAAVAGIAAYSLMKGEKRTAYLVGAAGTAVAVAGLRLADSAYISPKVVSGPVPVKATAGYSGGYGMIMPNRNMRGMGMLMPNNRGKAAGLAALSMALDEGNDVERMLR
jgi:hypothetical protein